MKLANGRIRAVFRMVAVRVAIIASLGACTPFNPPPIRIEPYLDVSSQTVRFYDADHGTQIEYLDVDGRAYLWYPGADTVNQGAWRTRASLICFDYGANSYNPVTRRLGGRMTCRRRGAFEASVVETRRGDVFGLSRNAAVPFRLGKERTTIDRLLAKAR